MILFYNYFCIQIPISLLSLICLESFLKHISPWYNYNIPYFLYIIFLMYLCTIFCSSYYQDVIVIYICVFVDFCYGCLILLISIQQLPRELLLQHSVVRTMQYLPILQKSYPILQCLVYTWSMPSIEHLVNYLYNILGHSKFTFRPCMHNTLIRELDLLLNAWL